MPLMGIPHFIQLLTYIVFIYWCHHKNCWSEYCIYHLHTGESSAETFLSPEAAIWIHCKVERIYRCRGYVSGNYQVTSQMKRYKSSTGSNSKSWGQLLGEEGWERAEEFLLERILSEHFKWPPTWLSYHTTPWKIVIITIYISWNNTYNNTQIFSSLLVPFTVYLNDQESIGV